MKRYVAIAAVSAAVLLVEVAVTRVLSVVLWYHFAFLAVSLAMLGLGVPGVWLALRGVGPRTLERALLAASITVPLSIVALFRFGAPLELRTALATICIAVPMLALGSAVCVLLIQAPGRELGRLYGADLIGATLAALAVVPLMHVVPTPAIVAGAGALPALALIVLGRRRQGIALMVGIAALIAWGEPLRLRYSKTYTDAEKGLMFEQWTPTARLSVFSTPFWIKNPRSAFGWGFGTKYVPRPIDQLWLEQDGSAGTPITRLSGSPSGLPHLAFDVTSVAYQLQPAPRVCVIGAGGGRDILTALSLGAREVDAVELNPHTVDLVSRRFGAYSGDVYHLPGVRAVVSEGRSFLTSTPRRYDLIEISLIDSWAATSAGAYAMSENYLYTTEAYRLYWKRLAATGMISTSRWIQGGRRLEALRLAHLVGQALLEEGVESPGGHIAVVQGGDVGTVIASARPFTGGLLDTLDAVCAVRGFQRHWPPPPGPLGDQDFASQLQRDASGFRQAGLDLEPPVDDRPFFFHLVRVFRTPDPRVMATLSLNEHAVSLLRTLLGVVAALALALFFLPFVIRRRVQRGPGFWRGSLYFAAIGLGFMWVEVPLVQRTILYLGHPSYATTVILSSLLLGAGLGALASGRMRDALMSAWGVTLLLALVAVNLGIGPLFVATIGAPWALRAAITFALTASIGFLMGFALPLGMYRFGDTSKAWFWAINGACGVLASVSSLALAMTLGFTRVIFLGIAAYAVAVALLIAAPRATAAPVREPRRSGSRRARAAATIG